jgi:hypothetical protein
MKAWPRRTAAGSSNQAVSGAVAEATRQLAEVNWPGWNPAQPVDAWAFRLRAKTNMVAVDDSLAVRVW